MRPSNSQNKRFKWPVNEKNDVWGMVMKLILLHPSDWQTVQLLIINIKHSIKSYSSIVCKIDKGTSGSVQSSGLEGISEHGSGSGHRGEVTP